MKWYHWSVPPLLALAGYFAAGSGQPDANGVVLPTLAAERRAEPLRTDMTAALDEFNREWEATQKQAAAEDATMPVEDLRAKLVKLKQAQDALTEDSDWETASDLHNRLYAAAWELGRRQGAEAIPWIESLDPKLLIAAMDGWAKTDPDAALKAVTASDRRGPCSIETLMKLLQFKAAAGGPALKQACGEVPWELFRDLAVDPFGFNGLEIPDNGDVHPWIESGAARDLAAQGVEITNLFQVWATQDPGSALAQALDWPGKGTPILNVLGVGLKDPERADQIRSLLEALPPDQFSRVSEAVSKYRERRSFFGDDLVKTFPMLQAAKEEEEEQ
jgi:hypothetical protein